ncbi:MAG: hypothetical protein M1834_005793 [Cirrosporium novae-zelandiae]|nr:MAG: hypothetical protein M1834_005793 [Cirrosporium novae-zelandiae]
MRADLLTLLSLCATTVLSAPYIHKRSFDTFDPVTVFTPPSDYNSPYVLYARTVQLTNGDLLSTWENYSPEPPLVYFPIFKSTDGGETWTHISNITDQANGWGMRYQPDIFQLTEAIGDYPSGTILCAGNSIPTDLSQTQIDMYASTDLGYTWEFVSHIALGGEAEPTNGLTPVWEPFIMTYNSQVVVYYSDQRANTTHGQKLVHQVSSDLLTWDDPVDDVAYSTYTDRPGMTTVTKLSNGSYLMTYEYGGGPASYTSSGYHFPIYYRLNTNPLDFNSSPDHYIKAGSTVPTSSPYVVYTSAGNENGTIVVSAASTSSVFVNQALGHPDAWVRVSTPAAIAYSRSLRIMQDQPTHLLIAGAGLNGNYDKNVTVAVMDIIDAL